MIEKQRFTQLSRLAWPILGGMVANNLLLLIDTAMVGHLGPVSLAAVALGGVVNQLMFGAVVGLGAAVQATVARRIGEGRDPEAADALHAGLLLALVLGCPVALAARAAAPGMFGLFRLNPEVFAAAVPYFAVVVWILPGMGFNAAYRGFFNGIGKTGIYMTTILIVVAANIFLNWVFIYGRLGAPRLEERGAGLASVLAIYIGTCSYTYLAMRLARKGYGFGRFHVTRDVVWRLSRLTIPGGLAQVAGSVSSIIFFGILGAVGTLALAASTVVFRIAMVAILPAFGLGLAGATLVGQALGRNEPHDARHWGWDTLKVSMVVQLALGLPMAVFPRLVLRLFVSDPQVIALAAGPLVIVGLTMAVNGSAMVLMQLLNGSGDQKFVMTSSAGYQLLCGLPAVYLVALHLHLNLNVIWLVQVANYLVVTVMLALRWRADRWTRHRI